MCCRRSVLDSGPEKREVVVDTSPNTFVKHFTHTSESKAGTIHGMRSLHMIMRISMCMSFRTLYYDPVIARCGKAFMHHDLSVDDLLQQSKILSAWIGERIDGLRIPELPDDKRLQLSMACQHMAIEHATSIIILVDSKKTGSALTLIRPMFESMVRGLWLRFSATDDEISKAEKDDFPGIGKIIAAFPTSDSDNSGTLLQEIKNTWWKQLCGYTHTGVPQIHSRLDESGVRSSYLYEEIETALRWANLITLFSSVEMASAACNNSLVVEFHKRMEEYR